MSTSRNLEKFSTPENWRVFVASVRKQTGANAGNGPLLLENVTLIHPIKGRAFVDIHPDTPLFSHCRAFSVTLTQSNEDVCSFSRWLTPTVSVSRPARPSFLVLRHKSSPTGMRLQSLLCNFLSLFVWNFLALTSSMNLLMPCVCGVCFRNIFLFFSIASVF